MKNFHEEEFLNEIQITSEPVKKEALELINKKIRKKRMKTLLEYIIKPGKWLRPVLTLEGCRVCGGQINESAIHVAASGEMAHKLSLLKDDKIDFTKNRKGRGLLHNYTNAELYLAELYLNTLAVYELFLVGNKMILDRSVKTLDMMIDAQLEREKWKKNKTVPTSNTYEDNCYRLSGVFWETACWSGGVCGNGSKDQVDALSYYGKMLGISYQKADDVNDFDYDGSMGLKLFDPISKEEIRSYIRKQNNQSVDNGLNRLRDSNLCTDFFERFSVYVKQLI